MGKFTEYVGGKWLKAADVGPRGLKGIIEEITEESVFDNGVQVTKMCVWIKGQHKGFLPNAGNRYDLSQLLPDEFSECVGHKIALKLGKVKSPKGSGMVDGIQIDSDAMTRTIEPTPSRKPSPPVTQEEADQDIPF